MSFAFWVVGFVVAGLLYLYHVDRAMLQLPEEARLLSPKRWTLDEIKAAYKKAIEDPIDVSKSLPPKQDRRYIVVGGSGLVGNWLVSHLVMRGENPAAIRVVDLSQPNRKTMDSGVAYVKTNITDETSVSSAFNQEWPADVAHLPLTVFHTAAVIRPGDRLKMFLPLCRKVNVGGTQNVLNAAKKAGASCLIATSSGSVTIHRTNFWIPPWQKTPTKFTQVVSDATPLPKEHGEFFGNYPYTKIEAERLVLAADDVDSNFRTGCIRPTNGVYGISDTPATITGTYLKQGGSPTWMSKIIQNFVNAENVSIAHLLYEQRLIEQTPERPHLPNIGGQSFIVTDPNPAIAFSDIYLLLPTLAKTPVKFPTVSPVPLYVFSYFVELYAVIQHCFLPWLPRVTGDLAQMQPALWAVSTVHTIADDSRARKSPEEGGLGYNAPITTLDGMCKEVYEWNRNLEKNAVRMEEKPSVSVSAEGVDVNMAVPPKKLQ